MSIERRSVEQLFHTGDDIQILGAAVAGARRYAKTHNSKHHLPPGWGDTCEQYLPEMKIHLFGELATGYTSRPNWKPFDPLEDINPSATIGEGLGKHGLTKLSKTSSEIYFVSSGPLVGTVINRLDNVMAQRWLTIASGVITFNLPEYNGFLPVAQIIPDSNGDPRIRHSSNNTATVISAFAGHSSQFYYGVLTGENSPVYGQRKSALKILRKITAATEYVGFDSRPARFKAAALVAEIDSIAVRQTAAMHNAGVKHHDPYYNYCVSFCPKADLAEHLACGGNINNLPFDLVTYNPLLKLAKPSQYQTIVRLIDFDNIQIA